MVGALAKLGAVLGAQPQFATLMAMTGVLFASVLSSLLITYFYFGHRFGWSSWRVFSVIMAIMLVSMLTPNPWSPSGVYLGVGTPNPWHNPTSIFAKPFCILVFLGVIEWLGSADRSRRRTAALAIAGISGVFAMWAKPSFLISFLPTIGVYCLWMAASGRMAFRNLVVLCMSLLPALVPLILIQKMMYGAEGADSVVVVDFGGVWGLYSKNILVSIALAAAFPLYVAATSFRSLKAAMHLALVNFAVSSLVFYSLAEQGPRYADANFSWSYLFGLYFLFFAACDHYFFVEKRRGLLRVFGWGLLVLHLVSGIVYFCRIYVGESYY